MSTRYSSRPTPTRGPVAPVHRGPQAMPQQPTLPTQYVHAPNAALLIDFDNVTMGIRSDLQSELKNLLGSDIVKGKVSVQRAYADWRRYPQYIVPLSESSIDLIFAPAYGSSKKNATDIRLAIDALELVFTRPEIGTFILLSGDSDFSSLVIKLKEYGKYVIGVGIRESSSDLLVQNCDEYYSYNALAGLVKAGEDEAVKRDPWELVAEAIDRMQRNGDVMRSDRLKQVMQEIDSTFDEKDLGMAKFSRFVQEAAARGLVTVTKLENGQLEVTPPRAKDGAGTGPARGSAGAAEAGGGSAGRAERGEGGPPQQQDAARGAVGSHRSIADKSDATRDAARDGAREEEDAGEERGRRGRRGGRGRGRDRGERDDRAPRESRTAEAPGMGEPPVERAGQAAGADVVGAAPSGRAAQGRDHIGLTGERLTRNEAFDLVRRAVESMVRGDEAVSAQRVREQAYELLGRDSESLSERNFRRILQDAHDSNVIDLRRRGDDYEVALVQQVASVADQLNIAAAAQTAQAAPTGAAPAAPPPRGMGPRGGGGRGRAPIGARAGSPPPELLAVGVVNIAPTARGGATGTATGSAAVPAARPASPAREAAAGTSATPRATEPAGGAAQSTAVERGGGSATDGQDVEAPAARARGRGARGGRGRGRGRAAAGSPPDDSVSSERGAAQQSAPELSVAGELAPTAPASPTTLTPSLESGTGAAGGAPDAAAPAGRRPRAARGRGAARGGTRGKTAASDAQGSLAPPVEQAAEAAPAAAEATPRRRRSRSRAATTGDAQE